MVAVIPRLSVICQLVDAVMVSSVGDALASSEVLALAFCSAFGVGDVALSPLPEGAFSANVGVTFERQIKVIFTLHQVIHVLPRPRMVWLYIWSGRVVTVTAPRHQAQHALAGFLSA